jgi:hypothetical protein
MQRGSQSIFATLFTDENTGTLATPERRGRSEELLEQRNELLFCRYYFYAKICRKQYNDTLLLLRTELFIESRTIINTIQNNSKYMQQLRMQKPDVGYFKKKFPFMVW